MSDKEVLKKFYYGSYKSSKCVNFLFSVLVAIDLSIFIQIRKASFRVLYTTKKEMKMNRKCDFYILNQAHDLTDDEFEQFWYHVRLHHPNTYDDILNTCRLKLADISENKKVNTFTLQSIRPIGPIHSVLSSVIDENCIFRREFFYSYFPFRQRS